jgi:hypothetical protein
MDRLQNEALFHRGIRLIPDKWRHVVINPTGSGRETLCPKCISQKVTVDIRPFFLRFETVLLCTPPKGPKMTREAVAKYMKKYMAFVTKWTKQYSAVENVDDRPNCGSMMKTTKSENKPILRVFANNTRLSLQSDKQY